MNGPDELRKVADSLLTGGSNYRPLRDRLYVYADAWQKQAEALVTANNKMVELCKRLEAAETELVYVADVCGDALGTDPEYRTATGCALALAKWAAFAGKETK